MEEHWHYLANCEFRYSNHVGADIPCVRGRYSRDRVAYKSSMPELSMWGQIFHSCAGRHSIHVGADIHDTE